MIQICFASNNAHKLCEVRAFIKQQCTILSLADIGYIGELPEEYDTISANSYQKAEYVYTQLGVNCMADDSGLEIDALQGAPGVNSAFYAGPQRSAEDNINLVLTNMNGTKNRKAQFKTVITYISKSTAQQFEGILPGTITTQKIGTNGFGYDPIFIPDGYSKTLAEMTLEQKTQLSHRTLALQKWVKFISEIRY